jgi:hypothetical protein
MAATLLAYTLVAALYCLIYSTAVVRAVEVITLENDSQFKVVLITTGATIQKLYVPGCGANKGKQIDVALG